MGAGLTSDGWEIIAIEFGKTFAVAAGKAGDGAWAGKFFGAIR